MTPQIAAVYVAFLVVCCLLSYLWGCSSSDKEYGQVLDDHIYALTVTKAHVRRLKREIAALRRAAATDCALPATQVSSDDPGA
jgi:hypothetical protein